MIADAGGEPSPPGSIRALVVDPSAPEAVELLGGRRLKGKAVVDLKSAR